MKQQFFKEDIGKRVYSILHGWGEIRDIDDEYVWVVFSDFFNDFRRRFTKEGFYQDIKFPILLWDELPESVIPPRPKQKKRYWLWNLKDINKRWYRHSSYMDDEGKDTSGFRIQSDWEKMAKIKCENDFIEVEGH